MADYIYLLEHRLTPAQRRAVEAVRDAARAHGMPVFVVGGAVRDLTSGSPVRDLDFALQGEVAPLLPDLGAAGATVAGTNPTLSATHLVFPGGVRAELGPTLSVSYPKPGQPETQPAAILDDLRRRDFTANAMAVSLNEGSYGLLLDPLNGVADIENRELRLVSNYGFIEQPATLLRAARLSERLGWSLEERTQGRYETAKEENYIGALPAWDRGYELEEIFHEEDPLNALEHLRSEGWGDTLPTAVTPAKADEEGIERLRDIMGQMESIGIHPVPAPALFPLLTAKLAPGEVAALKGAFARPGFVQQIESLEARSKELVAQMTGKAAAAPSDLWKLLMAADPEVLLWAAYSSRSSAVQSRLKSFLNEWPGMRQRIPYGLMQEMRITPDLPGYDGLLDDLFFAIIDGKLATPEATRAFLEPFSPPAPAPLAAPRRRAAKSARSRSKKAAGKVAPAEAVEDGELETTASPESAPAPVVKAAAQPKPTKSAVAKSAPQERRAEAPAPTPAPPAAPPLPASTAKAREPQKPPAKAPEPIAPAKAVAAPAPHKQVGSAAKTAGTSVKPVGRSARTAAKSAPASPKKATPPPAKKAAAPAPAKKTVAAPQQAKKVAAKVKGSKAPAKAAKAPLKIAARAAAPAKAGAAKNAPAKKVAAKVVSVARSGAKAAPKKAVPAKKKVTAKKRR